MADASETGAQHIGTFWMLELDRPLPPAIIPRVPAAFTRTGPEAAQELAQAMGFDNPEIVLQRLAAGRHCYTARVNGSLAAYGWVTFDEEAIGELGLIFRLKAGEAYIWDCATLPAYRRQRLYSALLAYIVRELRAAGLCRVWIWGGMGNLPPPNGTGLARLPPPLNLLFVNPPRTGPCFPPFLLQPRVRGSRPT